MSLWQRISTDASHAASDVYSHWVLGDDTGKSVLVPLVYHPESSTSTEAAAAKSLGLAFVEINGRAYVKAVVPGSAADRAGIAPHDAVQIAVMVRPPSTRQLQQRRNDPTMTSPMTRLDEPILGNEEDDVRRATAYAYHLEKQGARTSYDQLHYLMSTKVWPQSEPSQHTKVLAQHFVSPRVEPMPILSTTHAETSPSQRSTPASRRRQRHQHRMKTWNRPSIPPISCWKTSDTPNDMDDSSQGMYREFLETQPSSSSESSSDTASPRSPTATARPVVLMFRRTRQRQSGGAAASSESLCLLPTAFRLDDECDAACRLVQRLAPTADMAAPVPDTWEELVHDGTDWLLGPQSMLPPKHQLASNGHASSPSHMPLMSGPLMTGSHHASTIDPDRLTTPTSRNTTSDSNNQHQIPLDDFEQVRVQKLAALRARMTAETMGVDRTDDVEAATVRAMIQKAVGLAFVRASKVVLGVSVHGGSGIVVSRLSDGTWSAPSAIGMWGCGFGIQFGLEVAEYIFILQTPEAMQHFRRGGSYTVGGNMGVAVGGLGREAYGAASVGGGNLCGNDTTAHNDDDYNDHNDYDSQQDGDGKVSREPESSLGVAPIVAYAKSQGLYVGVSLEGSRIFTRDDINCRTYKFAAGRNVTANDILSGKVPTPPEAEELYAALHSVEFTHEMSCLPRPPEVLRKISANAWTFDRSIQLSSSSASEHSQQPFDLFSKLSQREAEECDSFEAQFKNFMYGGVSVQRLLTDTEGHADRTGKERRTLWLMLPEIGSLRLGFVSKLSDGEGAVSNKSSTLRARRDDPSRMSVGVDADVGTVGSEDLTLDSALHTRDGSTIAPMRRGNVRLSDKHSVALTDVTVLSQEPLVPIKFKGDDKTQHLRVISIQDVAGASLLFLANNFREAELLVCGLKLLLERESARLGVRGGLPVSALGGRSNDGGMSPTAARGFRDASTSAHYPSRTSRHSSRGFDAQLGGEGDDKSSLLGAEATDDSQKKWGKQPSRDYMRGQASGVEKDENDGHDPRLPQYAHGQPVAKTIAKHVQLPLPLPLCRVLLLDSTSPVVKRWQKDRGDKKFDVSRWAFPSSTPRELERHSSEHQLIASGSMLAAHRTMSFDRLRNGSTIRLSETYSVEADDPKKVAIAISEKNPRRGFSARVRIVLRACNEGTCDASVLAELKPVGKDMSNQAAVHKAYTLVLDEIKARYGMDDFGLLAGFLSVVDEMSCGYTAGDVSNRDNPTRPPRSDPQIEEKKTDHYTTFSHTESGFVSFEDMLKTGRESPEVPTNDRPPAVSLPKKGTNPSPEKRAATKALPISDPGEFMAPDGQLPPIMDKKKDAVLIEVKPLPKIRLSLMPSPREEDEDENSSSGPPTSLKPNKKKKKRSSSTKSASKQSNSMFADDETNR